MGEDVGGDVWVVVFVHGHGGCCVGDVYQYRVVVDVEF